MGAVALLCDSVVDEPQDLVEMFLGFLLEIRRGCGLIGCGARCYRSAPLSSGVKCTLERGIDTIVVLRAGTAQTHPRSECS